MEIKASVKLSPMVENLLRNHHRLIPDALEKGMEYIGQGVTRKIEDAIKSKGLVDSGKLIKSVNYEVKSLTKTVVGTNAFYAHILEGGSNPNSFNVKPRNKKALYWPGATHPIKQVIKSPGGRIRAFNFFGGTITEMERVGAIEELLSKGVQEAINDLIKRGF